MRTNTGQFVSRCEIIAAVASDAARRTVRHGAGEVHESEALCSKLGPFEKLGRGEIVVDVLLLLAALRQKLLVLLRRLEPLHQLLAIRLVRVRVALDLRLLVEAREDALEEFRPLLHEMDARLVVPERDVRPVDAFRVVLHLLELEDVVVEQALELLVRKVDAELLERILLEDLEAEDVQNADKVLRRRGGRDDRVRLVDEPDEGDIVKDVRGSESNCEHDSRKM